MKKNLKPGERSGLSRRGFLKGAGATVAAGSLLGPAAGQAPLEGATSGTVAFHRAEEPATISFVLNGTETKARVQTGHTLLELLRDALDQIGTKLVCDMGSCGACTVLLDGRPVNSCLALALDADGAEVQTIEGLARDGELHPIQEAFLEEDALQCGFCTPGMVMSCKALLDRKAAPSLEETKEALSGNLCRCGTYVNIFRAVDNAAARIRGGR